MSNPFQLSEASSIAIHSMILIAQSDKPLNANQIADRSGTSKHHVAKVLQQLSRGGLLDSFRGPKGGFVLKKDPAVINFLTIYEIIEGEILEVTCPMNKKICPFDKCIMDGIISRITREFKSYLREQCLDQYLTH